MTGRVEPLLERLERAARRLEAHAAHPAHGALTDPDPGGEERWEAGQVWAHLAEFPAYWLDQARSVIAARSDEPVPFGRVKTDPGRIEAIERERRTAPMELYERARRGIGEAADALRSLPAEDRARLGAHPTLGVMDVERLFDRFIVGHLEEHADQLDLLAARAAGAPPRRSDA